MPGTPGTFASVLAQAHEIMKNTKPNSASTSSESMIIPAAVESQGLRWFVISSDVGTLVAPPPKVEDAVKLIPRFDASNILLDDIKTRSSRNAPNKRQHAPNKRRHTEMGVGEDDGDNKNSKKAKGTTTVKQVKKTPCPGGELKKGSILFPVPPKKSIMKPVGMAIAEFKMIKPGDRILVGLSGGKDSLTLLQ